MTSNSLHSDDDQLLGQWIRQAGDATAEPRPEHVDELRERLLARTEPAVRRHAPWRMVAAVLGAAVAATVLIAVFLYTNTPSVALADALVASRAKPWIHGITTLSDGSQTGTLEFWISPQRRVCAAKFGNLFRYHDRQLEVTTQYDSEEGIVYRVPELKLPGDEQRAYQDAQVFEQLLMDQNDAAHAFPGEKVVQGGKKELTENGKRWIEYAFTLERRYEPLTSRAMTVRVDAESRLLHSWTIRESHGLTAVTRFDYPDSGPADIYALGVPRSAKIVDRIPRGDLARIDAAMKAARRRFDDYDAIVVQHTEGRRTSYERLTNLSVKRVRRRGGQLRVDMLLTAKPGLEPPKPDADMSRWWKENREKYWSVPLQVCDGTTVYFYLMVDDRLRPDQAPNTAVELRSKRAMRLPADDPPVEWPHLMPEHYSHPHLWTSEAKREITLDADPGDGPEGSIRLIVTESEGLYDRPAGERYRYWIDPELGYALRKSVSTVFEPRSSEIAYIDTVEFDQFAQSPGGAWYPTVATRTTTRPEGIRQVTEFYLDFDSELPDEVFQPVEALDSSKQ